ncbi:hypothetical protein GCM10010995_22830 [Cysteiniphilum litorale]|uniref:Uncharacterized protein n=1 Tax=Cysteiniphilum litorale TaxID=2056700 RepID=A0A8J2Z610_9GAMM|nr:hypothetical protein GCM10010995_22830 [Cysteiniphilum litorale]
MHTYEPNRLANIYLTDAYEKLLPQGKCKMEKDIKIKEINHSSKKIQTPEILK